MSSRTWYPLDLTPTSPQALRTALNDHHIGLNAHAQTLLHSPAFTGIQTAQSVTLCIVTVAALGLPNGGTLTTIFAHAQQQQLTGVSLSVAAAWRLDWTTQPASSDPALHRHAAPQGAVTVASFPLPADPSLPKGVYLRNVTGQRWLRGYVCDDTYQWPPTAQFAFVRTETENF